MLGLGSEVGATVGPFVLLGSLAKWQQRYGRGNDMENTWTNLALNT